MQDRLMFYGATFRTFQLANELRKNITLAERDLWQKLRKKQLGIRFKSQHPIDVYIVDFYCHDVKLVIELDGEIHNYQKEYDEGRENELKEFGLEILRFTNEEVFMEIDRVIKEIKEKIVLLKPEHVFPEK